MAKNKIIAVERYVSAVLSGKVVAGRLVKLACERYRKDLKRKDIIFDADAARRVIGFFETLFFHTTGEFRGKPFILGDWQQFVIANLFGFKNLDGFRRYRTSYLEIARKNGKTALAAGLGLYMLIGDNEARAEIYSAATKLDQAKICFSEASRMVRSSPELKNYINVLKNNLSIEENFSKFEPLGSDYSSLDGLNIHAGIIDEMHAHRSRDLFDVLQTSTGSRRQSLIFCITTAGSNPDPSISIAFQMREFGVSILEGNTVDDTSFYYIACMDEKDDWQDEKNWLKSNPNLEISVKLQDLRNEANKVKKNAERKKRFFAV